jgi:hypothetical protein
MKGGLNGYLLVLLSLSWWLAVADTDSKRNICISTLDDVEWVLQQMVNILGKRSEVESDGCEDEGEARAPKR